MIVKRKRIFKESEYKRELIVSDEERSYFSICEYYKCNYRNLEGKCIDKNKQQCKDCEYLNFDRYKRGPTSYFYIHQ